MAADRTGPAFWPLPLTAALLLWPAIWNGYPIVFADTGTYLSQAIHHYLGWDRPPFYSVFMLPLHLTVSTWPVIVVQALLAAWVLDLVVRKLLPGRDVRWLPVVGLLLALFTWLPFLVSQLMPDVFTPLLVLVLCSLGFEGWKLNRAAVSVVVCLIVFAAFMVAAQQSNLLLSAVVLAAIGAARALLRLPRLLPWPMLLIPPAMAATALLGVNLLGHGRLALSPFGNVFLLARVIYDGPGMDALRRDCPARHWHLCAGLDRFPPTSDDFLWRGDSPILDAGGHKAVSGEATAIIVAAVRAEPIQELRAILRNGAEQLGRFESGDGLGAWPIQVTPWIDRDFPPEEQAAYAASKQARGILAVPAWVGAIHAWVAIAGLILCLALLPLALWRRDKVAGYVVVVLIVLPASALITGGLSTPHDRYQSRVMWLAPFIGVLSAAAMPRRPR